MTLEEMHDYFDKIIEGQTKPVFTPKDIKKIRLWFYELNSYWELDKAKENNNESEIEMYLSEIKSSRILEKQIDKE